ncbi:MAG TPA: PadR family transcriptional regulator [Lachnospiraceae bacterium]|nr:PadR family transcriptional regulator [Lachnospiraceae bacterium]
MLKHGILGLLNYGEMTGYEIMEVFRDSLNFFWSANTSQIYRELQTLSAKGFVSDTIVEQSGKPDKKVFSITKEGKVELEQWLLDEDFGKKMNFPILMKTFFMGELSKGDSIEHFRAMREDCQKTLMSISKADLNTVFYEDIVKNKEKTQYWNMTREFGIHYAQMMLEWCDSCIAKLEEK